MNTKIALSGFSILASTAIMAGSAFAVFTDTATSTGNTFSTGNADLQIALNVEGEEVFGPSVEAPDFSGMFPGDSRDYLFWLKNNSSSLINMDVLADVDSVNGDGVDETLDETLLVRWVCDTDGDGGVADNTPTAEFSPRAWFEGGNAPLGTLIPAEQMICRITGRIPDTAGAEIADESVNFSVLYSASQVLPTPTPTP